MAIESRNPATDEVLETFPEASDADIEEALAAADAAFASWRRRPFPERAALLRAAADVLRSRKVAYGRTMALEMGKPVSQGEAEVEKCAVGCEHYAEHGAALLAEEPHPATGASSPSPASASSRT